MNNPYRILVVDDNADIHRDFRKLLRPRTQDAEFDVMAMDLFGPDMASTAPGWTPFEYTIDSAYQGQEAVSAIERACRAEEPYAMAFMDIRMPPGWDGIETTKRLWDVDPQLQVVLCSAHTDYSWQRIVTELGERDNLLYLRKPLEPDTVRQAALSMVRRRQVNHELLQRLAESERKLQFLERADPGTCPSCGTALESPRSPD